MKCIITAAAMLSAPFNTFAVDLTVKMEEVSDYFVAEIKDANPLPNQDVWIDNIGRWTTICPRETVGECTDKLWEDKYNAQINTGYAISNSCGSEDCVVYLLTYGFR